MHNHAKFYDIAVLCIFFAVAYAQNRYIGFYHDDYAYAVLAYARNEPMGPFTVENLLNYLQWHYFYWGGRIVFFFFGIIAMQLEMQGFMLIQSCIVAITLFISYKIVLLLVQSTIFVRRIYAFTFLMTLYLSIKAWIYIDSMFWATASILYIWPMLCLMGGVYVLINAVKEQKVCWFTYGVASLCFFMAGASQEQIALAAVVAAPCMLLLFNRHSQHYKVLVSVTFVSAVSGFILLYAAPGNYVRMLVKNEPLPTLEGIFASFFDNTLFIIREFGLAGVIILGVPCVYVCIQSLKGSMTTRKILLLVCMAVASASIVYIAPIKGARLLFPSALLLTVAAAAVLTERALSVVGSTHIKRIVLGCTCLLCVAVSIYAPTWQGYYANYPVVLANDLRLKKISQHFEQGDKIFFYRLPDLRYAGCMPYDERPYIEPWIRQYYKLPQDAPFVYEDFPTP